MANSYLINTGDPRSVTGHIVSGAFASGIISGSINYKKYQNNKIDKTQAMQNTLKTTAQGGIATGAAILATNHLGPGGGGIFQAMTALSVGMASIYALEVADQALTKKISQSSGSYANSELNNSESDDINKAGQIKEDRMTNGE